MIFKLKKSLKLCAPELPEARREWPNHMCIGSVIITSRPVHHHTSYPVDGINHMSLFLEATATLTVGLNSTGCNLPQISLRIMNNFVFQKIWWNWMLRYVYSLADPELEC